ncbi:MAG: ammonium transporter [Patescibacteria group bacterium]|nr:ammonium transporter [Patescibacteria group bacterium]
MVTLDTGNTAFMLIATSLVMLMTPGLAFFYGGLVGRKNVLAIMIQSFLSMGWTTMIWFLVGYSLTFSGDWYGIIGNLDAALLRGLDVTTLHPNGFPLLVFVAYQMMFAIITPALITGAFANRVSFKAYLFFLTTWLIFVYFPIAHMAWGPNGLFQQIGALDFAGGTVVHATAGFAALASVLFVGKRKFNGEGSHSVPLVALGTGLLWFGWYGFNAGSELAADGVTALAFLNTDIAASMAAVTWLMITWVLEKKPKFVGLLTGAVAGLVAITPAAGFVTPGSAFIIGIVSAFACYAAVALKNRWQLDDALDVWGVHGVGGVVGCLMLGLLATTTVNAAGADGWFYGNPMFFVKEAAVVLGVVIYVFIFSYLMLWLINKITPVRITSADEELGLDESLHGEVAYE